MVLSYGFIETQGLIGSIEAADAMLKAAKVHLVQKREIGFGLVTVIVEGELGAVQAAVDAGREAAERIGQLISAHVIPRPFNDTEFIVQQNRSLQTNNETENSLKKTIINPIEKHTAQLKIKASKTPKKSAKKKKIASVKLPEKIKPEEKNISSKEGPHSEIVKLLKSKKSGLTLNEISLSIKKDPANTRIILKQLIDQEIIEKVQQRYYIL